MNQFQLKNSIAVICLGLALSQQIGFAQSKVVQDAATKKKIATMFQNIASTGTPYFYNGKISDKTLADFGVAYNYLRYDNRFSSLSKDSNKVRIAAKYVASPIATYFGRQLKHQSPGQSNFKYSSGYYYGYQEEFEGMGPMEIRDLRIVSSGNTYTAYGNVVDDFGEETVEKKQLVIKKSGTGKNSRLIVMEFSPAK